MLSDTKRMGIKPDGSSFKIYSPDGTEYPQFIINQEINVDNPSDNYYTNFIKSIETVFLWTSGRWDQLDQWDFWPVDIYSIIGNILLVVILQNMLIAIMT